MPRSSGNFPFEPPGGSRGGLGDAMGRAFRQNPLTWAVPLYTAWGIRVKLHVFFILMIIFELLSALTPNSLGLAYTAVILATLWILVLLHEYGHCFTCRRVGGEADEILLWPLGGLAMCRPPHAWKASLATTIGGPAVNAVLVVPLATLVMALGGQWQSVIFNPFDLAPVVGGLGGSWALIAAWSAYFTNWMLLAFNVLLPMFPMDGGRILHAILWARIGHQRATAIAARVGFFIAIALGLFALVFNQGHLLGLAIFGGLTCWGELQHLRMMGHDMTDGESWRGGPTPEARADSSAAAAESRRQLQKRNAEAARLAQEESEVNRLLDKIKEHGMQSLSAKERKFLEQATQRRRGS